MELIFIALLVVGYLALSKRIKDLEQRFPIEKNILQKTLPTSPISPVLDKQSSIPTPEPVLQNTIQETSNTTQDRSERDKEFEFKVGSKLFTGVGIVAILFGVGFFLRYAFENNLIDERARVALGLLGGLILLGVGWFTNKKYSHYGQVVTGGGLGLLYLSLYTGFNFYSVISQPVAFFAMIVVTIVGVSLALVYNSLPLAGFAIAGGFLTPFLASSGNNQPHSLFLYIALLDIGVLALAWRKVWPLLTIGSFVGTVLVYISWFFALYTESQFGIAFLYTSLFFLLFLFITLLHRWYRKAIYNNLDILIAIANPLVYFVANFFEIDSLYPSFSILFVVALGGLYFVLAFIYRTLEDEQHLANFSQILFAVSFIFFIIAIPVQLEKQFITIGWGAEALALLALGFLLNVRMSRLMAICVFILVLFRLIVSDSVLGVGAEAWTNARFLTYLISFILFSSAGLIYWFQQKSGYCDTMSLQERNEFDHSFTFILLASFGVALLWMSLELEKFQADFWLPIWWSIIALLGGIVSLMVKNISLRFLVYLTYLYTAFYAVIIEGGVTLSLYTPFFNSRVFMTIVIVLSVALFAFAIHIKRELMSEKEHTSALSVFMIGINGLLLWLLSVEVLDYFNRQIKESNTKETITRLINIKRAMLSVAWTLYAIVLLIMGIIKKSSSARILAIFLFGVVVVKVFLVDTANLNNLYRFVSFMSLGVILLISGFLYYRFRERIMQFIEVEK